ncbi:TetR/AcrR family transcriptional regulator [Microbacterium xylanilyticum]
MPRVVDHDARRRDIAAALLAVAARDGHEGVNSRAVARELGVAVGSLWHYFDGFDDVIRAAAAEVTRRTEERIRTATDGLRGLARLDAIMREVLPIDAVTRTEAHIVVGFWGRLASLAPASDASSATLPLWRTETAEALAQAVEDGELRPHTPLEDLLALLRAITYGQQIVEVAEPADAAAHLRVLAAILDPWRT